MVSQNGKSGSDTNAAVELSVSGMTCRNCARHVSEALQGVPGVAGAIVSLEQGSARVQWQPGVQPKPSSLVDAVKAAGYEAKPQTTATQKQSLLSGWGFNITLGLACLIPLLVGEWFFNLAAQRWFQWLAFALALPVQILCGARFYRGAWNQLKVGTSSMDTLVALGSTTAFCYSVWALFSRLGGHLYFMEAIGIITLISLGHWVEARMSLRAEGSLRALLHLSPQMARRRNANGSETEVPVKELRTNDIVSLSPGDRIPTDGESTEGQSTVDESMLTGESIPIEKQPGSKLYAGTVNVIGHLLMRVTATGESTALAHIIAAVQRAQNSRAQIQRLADRVSSVFVPIVVLIALATGLWWGFAPEQARRISDFLSHYLWHTQLPTSELAAAIMSAAAVLIVACPCAMGLATPVAIMAGTNAAARRGILIRDGIALERAGQITAVVFDKTGTLTQGKPAVVDVEIAPGTNKHDALKLAAALARRSQHPLSLAVAHLAPDEVALKNWQEIRGSGVQAQYMSSGAQPPVIARLGSLRWLQENGVNTASQFSEKWMSQEGTILGLSMDGRLTALIALRDTLKPGSAEVIQQITAKGMRVFLITGDNQRTALAIAQQAAIPAENVFAGIQPDHKAEIVKQMQEKGERVAFVGDGINDAPALEQADLGIAVCEASDVANEAADLILLRSEIEAIPEAITLARASLRTIKQNLFWAFFYNAAAIPLAALGLLSPIVCAAAMGVSDIVVIGNALRLSRIKVKAPRQN